jgi:hypothetical protein
MPTLPQNKHSKVQSPLNAATACARSATDIDGPGTPQVEVSGIPLDCPACALGSISRRSQEHRQDSQVGSKSALSISPSRLPAGDRERTLAISILVMQVMTGDQLLLAMPRDNSVGFKRQRSPYDFGEPEFKDHFR